MERKMVLFSRHPSHAVLRGKIQFPFKSCLRLGSTTEGEAKYAVELNSVEAVQTSSNKRLMKEAFDRAGICTAKWYNNVEALLAEEKLKFPIVAKNILGSRGTGNYLIESREKLEAWRNGKTLENYIFEKFYSYNREYRLHVTKDGCFYTCRKLLKDETPADKRWFRNDSNSLWVVESNPTFNKPGNWDTIVDHCVRGLQSVGLDVAAFDVKVQSNKEGKEPEFIIIESNSAPSFGEITAQRYLEVIPALIKEKYENQ